jgi:hypothetical protein
MIIRSVIFDIQRHHDTNETGKYRNDTDIHKNIQYKRCTPNSHKNASYKVALRTPDIHRDL